MRPIETVYADYRFRSRLEARWAVFFDHLGIQWEYEREGYELQDGSYYLPDFWLPRYECWVEVKPEELTDEERKKCELLAKQHKPVILAVGLPELKHYEKILLDEMPKYDPVKDEVILDEHGDLIMETYLRSRFVVFSALGHDFPNTQDTSLFESEWRLDLQSACAAAKQARFEYGVMG